jgi:regulator of nucleoside diphosphate kinase
MNTINRNPVVLSESDYTTLNRLASYQSAPGDNMSLRYEINRAIVVKDSAFPSNTIRISSKATVIDLETDEESSFRIVMPGEADIHQRKISILTPMGTALIGFREGDELQWRMPKGMKRLKVLKVEN